MEPTYSERQQQARERLYAALDPQTNREKFMVDWLMSSLIAQEADEWSEMVERVGRRAYDRGYAERRQS